jgi:hypothetical protein
VKSSNSWLFLSVSSQYSSVNGVEEDPAAEIHRKLVLGEKAEELVRDVESLGTFTAEEMRALKRTAKSLRQPAEDEESEL